MVYFGTVVQSQVFTNGTVYDQIKQLKQFDNQAIEPEENASFELSQFFVGSLLNYQLNIVNTNRTLDFDQASYAQMMKIDPPNRGLSSYSISDFHADASNEPFPRSSVLIQKQGGLQMRLIILRKNFTLSRYEASKFADGIVTFIDSVTLKKSIVNDSCQDMTAIQGKAVLLFCRSVVLDEYNLASSYVYSTVQVDGLFEKQLTVRYLSYTSSGPSNQDFRSGLRFIGYDKKGNDTGILFLGNRVVTIQSDYVQQGIFRIDYQIFEDMKKNGTTEKLNTNNPIQIKMQISYYITGLSVPQDILDYGVYNHNTGMLGLLFNHFGLLFCIFGDWIYKPSTYILYPPVLSCNDTSSQFFPLEKITPIALYQNQLEEQYMYVVSSYPPGVLEIDVSDPYNSFLFNQYQTSLMQPFDYVGLQTIATNRNYIIHLMLKVDTNEQVLRVYNRNSTRFNIILTDFILPPYSKTTFFAFPNLYINIMLFRDEKRINITSFQDYRLQVSGTNVSLFNNYLYDIFELTLFVSNNLNSLNTTFYVQFVDNNSTQIQATSLNSNVSIFYNCGDNSFQFQISYLFNGPNYNVSLAQKDPTCDTGQCYFDIVNQDFEQIFEEEFNFTDCENVFMFPDTEDLSSIDSMIMICVSKNASMVSSYYVDISTGDMNLTGSIEVPMAEFLYFEQDVEERAIFSLTAVIDQQWVVYNKEIHYFDVTKRVFWKNYTQNFTHQYLGHEDLDLLQVKEFTFNHIINKGVIVANMPDSSEVIIYYEISFSPSNYTELGVLQQFVLTGNQTKRAKVSSNNFLYTLNADNTLRLHQVVSDSDNPNSPCLIIPLRVINTTAKKVVYDFDIFDGKYFIVYSDESKIEVYEILNEITLQYKMKLPLYKDYQTFKFDFLLAGLYQPYPNNVFPGSGVNRAYYNGFLSVYLVSDSFKGSKSNFIFIYDLAQNQHNSYVMDMNSTALFTGAKQKNIIMTGNGDHDTISLFSDSKMQIYAIQYYNFLVLKNNNTLLQQLIANCSRHTFSPDQRSYNDALTIAQISVVGQSVFDKKANLSTYSTPVMIQIYSDNQGYAITATNNAKNFDITFEKEDQCQSTVLILEDFVQGFNLTYDSSCSFYDMNGQLQDCSQKAIIVDSSFNTPYNFSIEFVTNIRQVIFSVSMGKLFFLFDSQYNLNVEILFNDYNNDTLDLDSVKGYPLKDVGSYSQEDILGCQVINVLSHYFVRYNADANPPNSLYLVSYQCYIGSTLNFRLAAFYIFDYADPDQDLFNIVIYDNTLKLPYKILAMEKGVITWDSQNKDLFSGVLVLACDVEGSYSNIVYIYNYTVDLHNNLLGFHLQKIENSLTLSVNTFKITSLLSMPNTNIVLLVDSTFGIYIYDLDLISMIWLFNLKQETSFNAQQQKVYGPLQVFSVYGDWPYNIQILTNYGIFIYTFNVNLTNKFEIYPKWWESLTPVRQRLIRSYYDNFKHQIVGNQYGYAFLVKQYQDSESFQMFLGVVSFYSNQNSIILRLQKISDNEECIALNYEDHQCSEDEDELAVSFICNAQLFIVKIQLTPSIEIDLNDYIDQSTKLLNNLDDQTQYVHDAVEYNYFNITIQATNQYTIDYVNNVSLNVNMFYKDNGQTSQPMFYAIGILLILIFALLIFFLNHGTEVRQQQDRGQFNEYSLSPQQSMYYKRHINLQEVDQDTTDRTIKKKKVRISESIDHANLDESNSRAGSIFAKFRSKKKKTKGVLKNKNENLNYSQ